ncbi:hypothetical protein Ctob_015835, partial [Chrysochromulina tobinii]
GLQRSGTSTLAELLGVLPGVSPLHFDARSARHMEAAPWKSLVDVHTGRRMKWAYFREVVSTGGAEGKLLQSVFPYRYAVWDAKFGRLPALLAHPSRLSPLLTNATREQLWDEWRQFWSTRPARVLLDKSPENVLMAPFLEALLGRRRQRAAQLSAALGKLGYAIHYVAAGPLNSTAACASATPAVICHGEGDTDAQYGAYAAWAKATRATPTLAAVAFTSLTLEVSRALLRLPRAAFDFPTAHLVLFTDDIHFERTRYILRLAGKEALLRAPDTTRVLAGAKRLELATYARARLVLLISEQDASTLRQAMGARYGAPDAPTDDAPADAEAADAPPVASTTEAARSTAAAEATPHLGLMPFGASPLPPSEVAALSARVAGTMLYVGTCHPVAKASVTWLVREVLPRLERRLKRASALRTTPQLRLAGTGWLSLASEAPFAQLVESGTLVVLGKLSVAALAQEYQRATLFISPLLNATGIATKNFHAMAAGLPVLTTPMGTAGLLLPAAPLIA